MFVFIGFFFKLKKKKTMSSSVAYYDQDGELVPPVSRAERTEFEKKLQQVFLTRFSQSPLSTSIESTIINSSNENKSKKKNVGSSQINSIGGVTSEDYMDEIEKDGRFSHFQKTKELKMHKEWKFPDTLTELSLEPPFAHNVNNPFAYLPKQFFNFAENHPFVMDTETYMTITKLYTTQHYFPLSWLTHESASQAGLNPYSIEPHRDYILYSFNYLELTEDDNIQDCEPWDETKAEENKSNITEFIKDLLRIYFVLIPKNPLCIPDFRNLNVNRKLVFANTPLNKNEFKMFGYFYILA